RRIRRNPVDELEEILRRVEQVGDAAVDQRQVGVELGHLGGVAVRAVEALEELNRLLQASDDVAEAQVLELREQALEVRAGEVDLDDVAAEAEAGLAGERDFAAGGVDRRGDLALQGRPAELDEGAV